MVEKIIICIYLFLNIFITDKYIKGYTFLASLLIIIIFNFYKKKYKKAVLYSILFLIVLMFLIYSILN
jgi:hypothetical protein